MTSTTTTRTVFVSDLTVPGQVAYRCQIQVGNVKAVAAVRDTTIRRGAYQLSTYAVNATGAALGKRQGQAAQAMRDEARAVLAQALAAAGWREERIDWGGREVALWWPKA
jgi:hypothetical protein